MRIYEGVHRGHPRLAGQAAGQGPPAHDRRRALPRLAGPHRRGDAGAASGRDAAAARRHARPACCGPWTRPASTGRSPLGVADQVPQNVARTNEFIGSVPRDRFVPFGTVHPELSVEENLTSLKDNGILGRQAAPAVPGPVAGRPAGARPAARRSPRRASPVITHAGAGGDEAANERGAPQHVARARRRAARPDADRLPLRRLPPARRGGGARRGVAGDPGDVVAADPGRPRPRAARAIIARHGADRVVFGSDWPMTDPAAEIAAIRALGLTPGGRRRRSSATTSARLLGLQSA